MMKRYLKSDLLQKHPISINKQSSLSEQRSFEIQRAQRSKSYASFFVLIAITSGSVWALKGTSYMAYAQPVDPAPGTSTLTLPAPGLKNLISGNKATMEPPPSMMAMPPMPNRPGGGPFPPSGTFSGTPPTAWPRPPMQNMPTTQSSAPNNPATRPPTAASAAPLNAAGRRPSDTTTLPQFKDEIEFDPRPPGYRVQFSLEDAELPELVKVMGQLTGRRFIFDSTKIRNFKASIYSPQKVTVAEAYQAFLSVLDGYGLTVLPSGRFFKIVETANIHSRVTPIYGLHAANVPEERYVTRLHRLNHVTSEEASGILQNFKSRDGSIFAYSPGNLLIITDTGTNIRRMMTIVNEIDVAGIGDQVWIEPVHYASAADVSSKLQEVFDVSRSGSAGGASSGGKSPGSQLIDSRVTKILHEDRSNSLIIIGTEKAYHRVLELVKILDRPLASGSEQVHVLPLQHAESKTLSETLNNVLKISTAPQGGRQSQGAAPATSTAIFEGPVKVAHDEPTNSLIITASARDYVSLLSVIEKLDHARRQVFIEAVVMEVSTETTNRLNVNLHGGSTLGIGPDGSLLLGGSSPIGSLGFPNVQDTASLQGLALGIRSNTLIPIGGTGLSIPAFGIALQALAISGDSNVLSTPSITVMDNEKSELKVGEKVQIQQGGIPNGLGSLGALGSQLGSASGAISPLLGLGALGGTFASQDVGTKLTMTPHINDSNEVRLDIEEEISELGPGQGATTIPRINQRIAKTKLVVQDQQTIVIGGLVRDFQSTDETKIPILGDIPLLGALFKQRRTLNSKRNLLLILTPYVIRDPADLRNIFERKMQERQEFLDRMFVFGRSSKEYVAHVDFTRTRGLLEDIRQTYIQADEKAARNEKLKAKEIKVHQPSKPIGDFVPVAKTSGASASSPALESPTGPSGPHGGMGSPPSGPRPREPGSLRPNPSTLRGVTIE